MRRRFPMVITLAVSTLAACSDRVAPTSPARPTPSDARADKTPTSTVAQLVRQLAAGRGIVPLPKAPIVRDALVHLGQALAFDKLLSGNRDISCMTCHLPAFATGDGKSLSVGQGAVGLGPPREHPDGVFIPRNAPPLFNINAMMHLFWDGRVSVDAAGTFHTPAGAQITPAMTRVFEFGAISALPMFPVTNRAEMRAALGNELAAIPDDDLTGIWAAIMRRLGQIPQYREMFEEAYPGTRFDDMTFAHASNAIAGFIIAKFSFDNSPWDRFLAGRDDALSARQLAGAQTFLTLKCSICQRGYVQR
jgi:cytochrome c peroxidase